MKTKFINKLPLEQNFQIPRIAHEWHFTQQQKEFVWSTIGK